VNEPVAGLLLAAGEGRRMGVPKALLRRDDGLSWAEASRRALLDGGCEEVIVVLGAAADEASRLLGDVPVVVAEDWRSGMGASLAAGLRELRSGSASAALVHLVDLPDVDERVVARLLSHAEDEGALARAVYRGRPGHPVLIGRGHWAAIMAGPPSEGARGYLADRNVLEVECGDLATGRDRDRPGDLDR